MGRTYLYFSRYIYIYVILKDTLFIKCDYILSIYCSGFREMLGSLKKAAVT